MNITYDTGAMPQNTTAEAADEDARYRECWTDTMAFSFGIYVTSSLIWFWRVPAQLKYYLLVISLLL